VPDVCKDLGRRPRTRFPAGEVSDDADTELVGRAFEAERNRWPVDGRELLF
jgi:hypothetical protein